MPHPPPIDFFTREISAHYDERNSRLAAISDCMHFLVRLVLKDLPVCSNILCVGAGTGAEILSLAKAFPEWRFVGVEPSASMLDICRKNLELAGVQDRCQFVHGYAQDLKTEIVFDAALSILVAHFVKQEDRPSFYNTITSYLRPKGWFVSTEISFDLASQEFPEMLKNWEAVQTLMGATSDSLARLPSQLQEVLSVISPRATEDLLKQSGIPQPIRFFQAFMICGWYGKKQ